MQLLRIEIDHDLALLAAIGIRDGRAGDGHELRSQKIQGDVVEILLLQALAGKRQLENRNARAL